MIRDFGDIQRPVGTDLDAKRIADVRLERRAGVAVVRRAATAGDGVDHRRVSRGNRAHDSDRQT